MARNRKWMKSALLADVDMAQVLDRRLRLAFGRAERREIVLADQARGRLAHGVDIEWQERPADPAGQHRRAHWTYVHRVEVGALEGCETRVEIVGHRLRPAHRDRWRQKRVRAANPGEIRAFEFGIEMHDLAERVHARIRATRDDRLHTGLRENLPARVPVRPESCGHRIASASRCMPSRRTGGQALLFSSAYQDSGASVESNATACGRVW